MILGVDEIAFSLLLVHSTDDNVDNVADFDDLKSEGLDKREVKVRLKRDPEDSSGSELSSSPPSSPEPDTKE